MGRKLLKPDNDWSIFLLKFLNILILDESWQRKTHNTDKHDSVKLVEIWSYLYKKNFYIHLVSC